MSFPYNAILSGTFTSDGTSKLLNIPGDVYKFEVYNETQFGSAAAATPMIRAQWFKDLPAGYGFLDAKTNGAATVAISQMVTANGFTLIDPTATQLQAAKVGTALTAANPAVATSNGHGYSVGDIIRVTNTTGMLQIAGMDFSITTVGGANNFTLGYLDSSGFAAAATAITSRKLNYQSAFYPKNRYITKITQAASAVITLSVTHGYVVGEKVRIYVPSGWGMTEINGQLATITAISTANNTITVNIDSSAYTAFAFPTSAIAAAGTTFPQVVPVGEAATSPYQNLLDDATVNSSSYQMSLGSSVVGGNADVIRWFAYRAIV